MTAAVNMTEAVEDVAALLWRDASQEYDYDWEPNAESFRSQARKLIKAMIPHIESVETPVAQPPEAVAEMIDDAFLAGHTQARLGAGFAAALAEYHETLHVANG